MSTRPLIETRPSRVSREQIVPRAKCDSGEVCCHQHVGEPRPAAVGRAHDEREMTERRAQAACISVYAGGHPTHLRAEGLEQQRDCPVEFVAEAAAATAHDLVDQARLIQRDRLG